MMDTPTVVPLAKFIGMVWPALYAGMAIQDPNTAYCRSLHLELTSLS